MSKKSKYYTPLKEGIADPDYLSRGYYMPNRAVNQITGFRELNINSERKAINHSIIELPKR